MAHLEVYFGGTVNTRTALLLSPAVDAVKDPRLLKHSVRSSFVVKGKPTNDYHVTWNPQSDLTVVILRLLRPASHCVFSP